LAAANDCNAGPDELEDEGTRRIGQPSTVRTLKGLVALGLSPGQLLLSRSSGDGVFTPRVSTGTSTRTKPARANPPIVREEMARASICLEQFFALMHRLVAINDADVEAFA